MYNVNEDYPKENPEWVHGIDISKFQDDENYTEDLRKAYTAGYRFVLIRATRGRNVDIKLEHNFDLAAEAGMLIGFYHYWHNNVGMGGRDQGKFHRDTILPYYIKLDREMLRSHIDVERYYNRVGNKYKVNNTISIKNWLSVMGGTRRGAGTYSSDPMWKLMTTQPRWANGMKGWIAQWTPAMDIGLYPLHWYPRFAEFWQWGVAGHPALDFVPDYVPGIKGQCDLTIFRGTMAQLRIQAGWHELEPVPEPVPEPEKIKRADITVSIDGELWGGSCDLKRTVAILD